MTPGWNADPRSGRRALWGYDSTGRTPAASKRAEGFLCKAGRRRVYSRAMNPWHDVAIGEDPNRSFHCVIEVPSGSKNKYELDKTTGLLRLDRVLYSAVHYPANYGFIPRTYCGDGDPLDVLVLCQEPVEPMCLMRARPIGYLQMRDDKGIDDKIISVHADDPAYEDYRDISELPPH